MSEEKPQPESSSSSSPDLAPDLAPGPASGPLALISTVVRFAAPVLLILVGAGVFYIAKQNAPVAAQTVREDESLVVPTIEAREVVAPRVWQGYGIARPMVSADVAAQLTARVISVPDGLEDGVPVEAGRVLAELEKIDFEQRVISARQLARATEAQITETETRGLRLNEQSRLAQEEVDLARRELQRAEDAAARGAATDSDVETRLASLRRAERTFSTIEEQRTTIAPQLERLGATLANQNASLRLSEQDLARATITSPIDGVLQRHDAERGELVSAGTVVARVVDLGKIEIPLRVAVSAAERVAVGDQVELRADNNSDHRWLGTVARIAPETDPASRTFTLFVEVEQDVAAAIENRRPATRSGLLLLPGQFLVGSVRTSSVESLIAVPRRALTGDRLMLAESRDSGVVVSPRQVVVSHFFEGSFPGLHPTETQWAVLRSGLESGEEVIIGNLEQIEQGMRVETRREQAAPDATASLGGAR